MSSLKRISLRTPHLNGACKNLLRGLVYEQLEPPTEKARHTYTVPTADTIPKSQWVEITHTLIHTHPHVLTYEPAHTTVDIRPHSNVNERHICMHSRRTYIPSSHRRTHNTTLRSGQRSRCSCSQMSVAGRLIFLLFKESGREQAGLCMHAHMMDGHIYPQSQKYHVPNPLLFVVQNFDIVLDPIIPRAYSCWI